MTDEKKPPQQAVAGAQIVIDISSDGLMRLAATCFGRPDSSYAPKPSHQVMSFDLPCLVAELLIQVRERRSTTLAETAAIKKAVHASSGYGVSGSANTL